MVRLGFLYLIYFFAAPLVMVCSAQAAERDFTLAAPAPLVESGFLKYLLPRFSLKTQIRITVVASDDEADVAIGAHGQAVFDGLGQAWFLSAANDDHVGVMRFRQWLVSEVGTRTIISFAPDGEALFSLPKVEATARTKLVFEGDVLKGEGLSRQMCGRCHAVTPDTVMSSIGSTPSFFVLRTLADWEERFRTFYVRNPHPAFTQVSEITPPFDEGRPPPIVPLQMELAELEAIMAYVANLEPADLGASLEHR